MNRFSIPAHHSKKPLETSILMILLILPSVLIAQSLFLPAAGLVSGRTYLSAGEAEPGSILHLALSARIESGWHINSDQPVDQFAIPTVFKVDTPDEIEVERVLYPEPEMFSLSISEREIPLYHGEVIFGAILKVNENTPPGSYPITTTLVYQGCNNTSCIAPDSISLETDLKVAEQITSPAPLHPEIFSQSPFVDETGRPLKPSAESEKEAGRMGGMIEERGFFLAFLLIFLGGLALNLTPCIYPIIPITVSYFVGQSGGKTSRTVTLAVLYVLGMSITYSLLGTIAATTGALFGSALQNPYVVMFISAVMIILASSMFGAWEIKLPSFLTRGSGSARQGYFGAVLMGLTVGIVAAPCIGPFVLGLLTYVGRMANPMLGFTMFFTLAWGMGIPIIVLGTASGSISKLPHSGNWMVWVKKIFGFILIGMAFYFARHLIGSTASLIGYAATALTGGIYLGWIEGTPQKGRGFTILRRAVGAGGILLAIYLITLSTGVVGGGEHPGVDWEEFETSKLASAAEKNRPVMIDFYADWCIPCHELDEKTFTDPGVIKLSQKVLPLKVDLTKNSQREKKLRKKFNIRGVPTIIFIDPSGRERTSLRVTGLVGPDEMKKRLREIINSGDQP